MQWISYYATLESSLWLHRTPLPCSRPTRAPLRSSALDENPDGDIQCSNMMIERGVHRTEESVPIHPRTYLDYDSRPDASSCFARHGAHASSKYMDLPWALRSQIPGPSTYRVLSIEVLVLRASWFTEVNLLGFRGVRRLRSVAALGGGVSLRLPARWRSQRELLPSLRRRADRYASGVDRELGLHSSVSSLIATALPFTRRTTHEIVRLDASRGFVRVVARHEHLSCV